MIHEPRCIHIPCTCIEILRDKINKQEEVILFAHDLLHQMREINKSLENKIKDGLSCCCSGCTKHNQDLSAPMDK
jgi:hypothetical protein